MKKLLRLFAVAAIAFALVACDQPNTEKTDDAKTDSTTTSTTTTTTSTTTPDPNPTPGPNPSDEPVVKDYFIDPITSIENLENTEWYFETTIDSAQALQALDLGNVATALTVIYQYEFMPYDKNNNVKTGPKPGYFWTDFSLNFKDNIPASERKSIIKGVSKYFNDDWFSRFNRS